MSDAPEPTGARALPSHTGDGPAAARTSRVARALCFLAALVCLTINGIALLDGMRGDQDDKTLLYATSALRPGNVQALVKLQEALPAILGTCPDQRCRDRTVTRMSSLANYLALSTTIRLARAAVDGDDAPFCERVSLAYYAGILLLHGAVYVLLLALLLTDRSPGARFSILSLLMLLAAALDVPFFHLARGGGLLSGVLPVPYAEYATAAYAPRGALALLFLLQVAAFASGRFRVWAFLLLLAPLLHAAEAVVLATVFAATLVLQILLVPDERRAALGRLAFLVLLEGTVMLVAWLLSGGVPAGGGGLAGVLQLVRLRDLVWLAVAAGLIALVRLRRDTLRDRDAVLLLVSLLLVLIGLDVVSAVLRSRGMGVAAQAYERFVGGTSFVIWMLPWLAVTYAAGRLLVAWRPGRPVRMATVAACVTLVVSSTALLLARESAAAAWKKSVFNYDVARSDLCAITRCSEHGCAFPGFLAMRPEREVVFHLQIFDLLKHWEYYRDLMRRSAQSAAKQRAAP